MNPYHLDPDDREEEDDTLDEEGMQPRRRTRDLPSDGYDVILYRLSQIETAIEKGFARLEARLDTQETRIVALENYRTREEERARNAAQQSTQINSRWVPILIAVFGTIATVILFIIQQGGQ